MLGENHSLVHEFPDYIGTISQLNQTDTAFAKQSKLYDNLDNEIRKLELRGSPIDDHEMNLMKAERAELKDRLYQTIISAQK
ncbi:TPA: YdcH family protein [Photobacterium damselae]